MLKKKLKDGSVVGLSMESVHGGVMLSLDEQPADSTKARKHQSFMLSPGEVSEFIDGLNKQCCHIIHDIDGRRLEFRSPHVWEHEPIYITIKSELVDCSRIVFPLNEHEISFIKKALESMAASLLLVAEDFSCSSPSQQWRFTPVLVSKWAEYKLTVSQYEADHDRLHTNYDIRVGIKYAATQLKSFLERFEKGQLNDDERNIMKELDENNGK